MRDNPQWLRAAARRSPARPEHCWPRHDAGGWRKQDVAGFEECEEAPRERRPRRLAPRNAAALMPSAPGDPPAHRLRQIRAMLRREWAEGMRDQSRPKGMEDIESIGAVGMRRADFREAARQRADRIAEAASGPSRLTGATPKSSARDPRHGRQLRRWLQPVRQRIVAMRAGRSRSSARRSMATFRANSRPWPACRSRDPASDWAAGRG